MASINGWEKGGIFTWVKGTLGERTGYLPKFFAKTTKHKVPIRLMITQSLIVTISAVLITFTSGADADFAFNVSLAATTAQYLMVYIIMLIAYMTLKRKYEDLPRADYMSKNATWSIIISCVALLITAVAFFVTFTPAVGTPVHLRKIYAITLIGMCSISTIIPLVLYHFKDRWQ